MPSSAWNDLDWDMTSTFFDDYRGHVGVGKWGLGYTTEFLNALNILNIEHSGTQLDFLEWGTPQIVDKNSWCILVV